VKWLALLVLVATLVALCAYGLAQPDPFVPIVVRIGVHESADRFARSRVPDTVPLVATAEDGDVAAFLFANDERQDLVVTYRARTGGWGSVGGAHSSYLGAVGAPLRLDVASAWSAPLGLEEPTVAWLATSGTVWPDVARVEIVFADGSIAFFEPQGGAFLLFQAWRGLPAPAHCGRGPAPIPQIEARLPREVIAYDATGGVLARRSASQRPAIICG
jgi:hypothetical protein